MKARRRTFLGAVATLLPATGVSTAPLEAPPTESGGLAEGLLAAARARFGHHLSPDEIESVRKKLESELRAADALRRFPLINADEPVQTFEARPRASKR
jgi:hypothetical protein